MQKIRPLLFLAASAILPLLLPALGRASPFDQVEMHFLGPTSPQQQSGGHIMSPYGFKVTPLPANPNAPPPEPILLVCIDSQHSIYVDQTWVAIKLTQADDLSITGWANAHQIFGEQDYLARRVMMGYYAGDATEQINAQMEAWANLDSNIVLTAFQAAELAAVKAMDLTQYGQDDTLFWASIGGQHQFDVMPTPEPSTLSSMGWLAASLLALRHFVKHRQRQLS